MSPLPGAAGNEEPEVDLQSMWGEAVISEGFWKVGRRSVKRTFRWPGIHVCSPGPRKAAGRSTWRETLKKRCWQGTHARILGPLPARSVHARGKGVPAPSSPVLQAPLGWPWAPILTGSCPLQRPRPETSLQPSPGLRSPGPRPRLPARRPPYASGPRGWPTSSRQGRTSTRTCLDPSVEPIPDLEAGQGCSHSPGPAFFFNKVVYNI